MKNPGARSQIPDQGQGRTSAICLVVCLLAAVCCLLAPSSSLSQPTQEEVFKSIGDNVNQPIDSTRMVAVVAGIAGVVILVVLVGQRRQRDPKSRTLNHHGRLMKEIARSIPLKGSELKQIKALAQDLRPRGRDQKLESPLTLLLCPTLLGEAAKQSRGKADLPVIAGLVKRLVAK